MQTHWPISPWVEANRQHIGFGLQVFPRGVSTDRIQYFVIQLPNASDQETMRLFAEQVIPNLKVN